MTVLLLLLACGTHGGEWSRDGADGGDTADTAAHGGDHTALSPTAPPECAPQDVSPPGLPIGCHPGDGGECEMRDLPTLWGRDDFGEHYLGAAIAGVGDVDGDGIGDLVASTAACEPPTPCLLVVHGPVTGDLWAEDVPGWTLTGSAAPESAVAGVGDLDGDGVPDVATATVDPGDVYLIDGRLPAGAPADRSAFATIEVGQYVTFPWVRGADDADGDGWPDVVTPDGMAAVAIYTGPLVGHRSPDDARTHVAASLASAPATGDVDGDGLSDLLLDHYYDGTGTLELFTSLPAGDVTADEAAATWTGDGWQDAFLVPAIPGDVDGDGYADVLVGSPRPDDGDLGFVWLFHGPVADGGKLADVADATFEAEVPGGDLGRDVVGTGDMNGDGLADYAMSDPGGMIWSDEAPPYPKGAAYLFLGDRSGHVDVASSADVVYRGPTTASFTGALAAVGDVDGDCIPDLALGDWGLSMRGEGAGAIFFVTAASLAE